MRYNIKIFTRKKKKTARNRAGGLNRIYFYSAVLSLLLMSSSFICFLLITSNSLNPTCLRNNLSMNNYTKICQKLRKFSKYYWHVSCWENFGSRKSYKKIQFELLQNLPHKTILSHLRCYYLCAVFFLFSLLWWVLLKIYADVYPCIHGKSLVVVASIVIILTIITIKN